MKEAAVREFAGKVIRREESSGWRGDPQVRLDLAEAGTKRRVHLYVAGGDALATLAVGAKVKIAVHR